MWIERVIARAFGPLTDETLELGEGMTVIGGPNEAGKTSWHAATRLALTGVRRGPGRTKETATVIERHRPWDSPDRWEVEARLHLADGRTIDISQDLAGRAQSRARDVVLGDNVSMEIINEGTPDATRWLGLDRESFASVAAVSQAQIMSVADSAASLQDHMQRAAATRGTDATAAEAIERLKAYRREAVGAVRVGATGPMWGAMRELEAGEAALAEARRVHADYLDREARLEEAGQAHLAAERRLAGAEAALARREADELAVRVARAAALAAAYPHAPAALATRDELADEVAATLEAWRRRPAPVALGGPSAAELQAQLAALPEVPDGDRRPDRSVLDASRRLDLAEEALRLHSERPIQAASPDIAPPRALPRAPIIAAAGAALAGIALLTLGQVLPGLALAAVALVIATWAFASRRAPAIGSDRNDLSAEGETRAASLREGVRLAEEQLRASLGARGVAATPDLRAATTAYEAACAERDDLARAAAGAEGLLRAIEARIAAEEGAARAAEAAAALEHGLRVAAERIGAQGDEPPEALAASLAAWQGQRAELARASEVAIREWQELQGLLAGTTLANIQQEAARRDQAAARLLAAAGDAMLAAGDASEAVASARAESSRAKATVDALTGELRQLATTLPDVAEAEERVVAARTELARVQELAAVIDETLALLEAAERRVHRDLAPILTESVQRHLPAITGGAYTEVGMNPRDLSVDVKEARTGQWRDARLLSEGTREQIYLLLRVAMAEHLVTTDERAPLLLDEVTAQSDPDRKRRILDVLHALSADRQVILFSHDAEVVDWATQALTAPRDRLVRLAAPTSSPLAEAASR
ncbi:MAG TPA: AAA family ATPase [Candidatus Limnocylindria bacterium]|nr:AAA family ATPase [Candidatus Limnocylindria bacterium]